jgi:hypothetical protein
LANIPLNSLTFYFLGREVHPPGAAGLYTGAKLRTISEYCRSAGWFIVTFQWLGPICRKPDALPQGRQVINFGHCESLRQAELADAGLGQFYRHAQVDLAQHLVQTGIAGRLGQALGRDLEARQRRAVDAAIEQ